MGEDNGNEERRKKKYDGGGDIIKTILSTSNGSDRERKEGSGSKGK